MVESFSGVDPLHFLTTGELVNPNAGKPVKNDKVFRSPNLDSQMKNAKLIKFQVFNFEKTSVVAELVFRGTGDLQSWFSSENLAKSGRWDLQGNRAKKFAIDGGEVRRFNILGRTKGCDFLGWMAILISSDDKEPTCSWGKWWEKNTVINRFQEAPPTVFEPPYIFYGTAPDEQSISGW